MVQAQIRSIDSGKLGVGEDKGAATLTNKDTLYEVNDWLNNVLDTVVDNICIDGAQK